MQPARRSLKLEIAITFGIQVLRLSRCTGDQFDLGFIKRVDQRNKAGGFITFGRAKRWDVLATG